jgi:hypothetical protein
MNKISTLRRCSFQDVMTGVPLLQPMHVLFFGGADGCHQHTSHRNLEYGNNVSAFIYL